ncbi:MULTISPECIES: hypothetical protein [Nonomuraea]|uniref:Uncharacterized protein n=1 Tax=Nonomuraea ferruginea TaxID=46174 RepID=A0ABT4SYM5_9ACTN|nr:MULTISPECIES: hypothetical protein [Nonomuraea]MDA0642165.1 hypothetical protein [Nonomuraea ferruginea]
MKRRITLVSIATAFLTALLVSPAVAQPDVDPFRNFHWTGERDIQLPWPGERMIGKLP